MATSLDILVRATDQASSVIKGVGASASQLGTQVETVTTSTSKASVAISGWAKQLVGFFGIAAGLEFAKKSLEAFDNMEKASKTLEVGLAKIHMPQALTDIEDWASHFADDTGILQADIETVSARLVNMGSAFFKAVGPDAAAELEKLTAGLEDMAAATGKSVQMLMRMLGPQILNAPEKAIASLVKYGVVTDAQAVKFQKLADAGDKVALTEAEINAIQDKFGGTAAKTATAYEKLGERINKLEVFIGSLVSEALGPLLPVLGAVTSHAGQLLTVFIAYKAATFLPTLISGIENAIAALVPSLAVLSGEMGSLDSESTAAGSALQTVGSAAATAATQTSSFGSTLLAAMKGPLPYILALVQGVQDLRFAFKSGNDDVDKVAQALSDGTLKAKDLQAAFAAFGDSVTKDMPNVQFEQFSELLKSAGVDLGRFGLGGQRAFDLLKGGLDEYNKSLDASAASLARQQAAAQAGIAARAKQNDQWAEAVRWLNSATGATSTYATATEAETAAVAAAAAAHRAEVDALRDEWAAELQLAGGFLGVEGAMLSATQAQNNLKSSRAELNKLTAAGKQGTEDYKNAVLAHNQAVNQAATAQLGLVQSVRQYVEENGKSKASTQDAISMVRQYGRENGLTAGEVQGLINKVMTAIGEFGKVPGSVKTDFSAPGLDDSLSRVERLKQYIDGLHDKEVNVYVYTHLRQDV